MTLATTSSNTALTQAQQSFEAQLPDFDRLFHKVLARRLGPDCEDAMADARAEAWKTWLSLTTRGRDPLAIGPARIASFIIRHVFAGRTFVGRSCGRQKRDIQHPLVHRQHGVQVFSYDAPVRDLGDRIGHLEGPLGPGPEYERAPTGGLQDRLHRLAGTYSGAQAAHGGTPGRRA